MLVCGVPCQFGLGIPTKMTKKKRWIDLIVVSCFLVFLHGMMTIPLYISVMCIMYNDILLIFNIYMISIIYIYIQATLFQPCFIVQLSGVSIARTLCLAGVSRTGRGLVIKHGQTRLPSKVQVPGSLIPSPLRAGDYLEVGVAQQQVSLPKMVAMAFPMSSITSWRFNVNFSVLFFFVPLTYYW